MIMYRENQYKKMKYPLVIFFALVFLYNLTPSNLTLSNLALAESKNSIKGAFGDTSKQSGPMLINSDNLSLDAAKRIFTYSGKVKLQRGDVEINSDRLIGEYGENNEIHTVTCDDNVVVTQGPAMRAKSEHAVYHVKQSVIELTEAPELFKDGSLLSADRIKIFVDQDRSEAEGNVRVKVIQEGDINIKK